MTALQKQFATALKGHKLPTGSVPGTEADFHFHHERRLYREGYRWFAFWIPMATQATNAPKGHLTARRLKLIFDKRRGGWQTPKARRVDLKLCDPEMECGYRVEHVQEELLGNPMGYRNAQDAMNDPAVLVTVVEREVNATPKRREDYAKDKPI